MLYWALVSQARHEHMSDEYKDRYINAVFWYSPPWVPNILEITTVGPQRTDLTGEGQADKQRISQIRTRNSRSTAETIMNPIGQSFPLICLHFETTINILYYARANIIVIIPLEVDTHYTVLRGHAILGEVISLLFSLLTITFAL